MTRFKMINLLIEDFKRFCPNSNRSTLVALLTRLNALDDKSLTMLVIQTKE